MQDGAAKGYNPAKPGRNSHHPLLACVADTRLVAKLWLRPGNSHTANHVSGFLAATRERQGATRGGLLRADSGFSDDAFLRDLEQREIPFLVAAKLPQPLQRALVAQTGCWSLADGLDRVSFDYQRPSWATPRTVVVIRQHRKYRDWVLKNVWHHQRDAITALQAPRL